MASEQGGHPWKLKTRLLALPKRLCRPKWHVASCSWCAKLGTLHTKKTYLLVDLSFVCGAECDGETSPSCASTKRSIDASNSSLEVQLARGFMQLVCEVVHFTHRKKLPEFESFTCLCQ